MSSVGICHRRPLLTPIYPVPLPHLFSHSFGPLAQRFHSLRTAVERATNLPDVCWVDLGPSGNPAVAGVKEKYGFTNTTDWLTRCDYAGEWQEVPTTT